MMNKTLHLLLSLPLIFTTLNLSAQTKIRYVAIGDSYTIGEGVNENERWPNQLVEHLKQEGIELEIVCNPSVTSWTTQQVIDNELPIYRKSIPIAIGTNFTTLLIGVNDWVQDVTPEKFRENLRFIITEMQKELTKKENLLLVTIPDFSATPEGPKYSRGRDITKGLAEFNQIIKEEAAAKNLLVADIFEISQQAKGDATLVAADGLHPSGKQYAEWEKIIFPLAKKILTSAQ
jgi:lysophospholipase L1-like esterase